jgi:hypothetical protein
MEQLIRILHLEDDPVDAELIQAKIEDAGLSCQITRVQTKAEFDEALGEGGYDLILADFHLPMYDGMSALRLVRERSPNIPFIFISGTMGEDAAIEGLIQGATDYVLKQRLSRLLPAIKRALDEAENWRERKRAEAALQASEARLAGIIESAMDAIISMDDNLRVVLFNAAAEQMFGCSAAEALDQSLDHFIPESLRKEYRKQIRALDAIVNPQQARGGFSVAVGRRINGEEFPIEVSISRIETSEGTLYTLILRDITQRKQAEEAQAKLEEQLRQSQKMESIGRLAGGVAHDFSNLLTVIRGYTDLIQTRSTVGKMQIESLEQIRQASNRAADLTRQLLALSRQQILSPTVIDLNKLVTNLNKMLGRLIGEDITVTTVLWPGLWSVIADPGQIEQVIMNLVVNARDAMPTGGRLSIETDNVHLDHNVGQSDPEALTGPCVILRVTDTGHGMDEATKAQIFEPFFTTKELGKGTGLGLATVYGIVKQSGGHIVVSSQPNYGTTFEIYLPANNLPANKLPASQSHPVRIQGGHETILVVDDEESVCQLVQQTLEGEGYTILKAHSGSAALTLARQYQGKIDLILTDVVMPHMSGREMAEQLKTLQPQMKVIFMSGYTSDIMVRHGVETAEIEFLPKPFSPSKLAAKVREVLDK